MVDMGQALFWAPIGVWLAVNAAKSNALHEHQFVQRYGLTCRNWQTHSYVLLTHLVVHSDLSSLLTTIFDYISIEVADCISDSRGLPVNLVTAVIGAVASGALQVLHQPELSRRQQVELLIATWVPGSFAESVEQERRAKHVICGGHSLISSLVGFRVAYRKDYNLLVGVAVSGFVACTSKDNKQKWKAQEELCSFACGAVIGGILRLTRWLVSRTAVREMFAVSAVPVAASPLPIPAAMLVLAPGEDVEVAPECFCPLTLSIMSDPVVAADGFTYEREAIEEWLAHRLVSPSTNIPLPSRGVVPNFATRSIVQREVQRWASRQPQH